MIINLFSVFDPTSYIGVSLNWIVIFIVILYVPSKYYLLDGGLLINFRNLFYQIRKIFNEISHPNNLAINFIVVTTFIYLIITNLIGLFPFVFTSSAHPMITLGWGIIFWLSFFIIGWSKSFKISAAHLVPEGSPIFLSPLIVLIESISHLIRPFTLSIRLAANIIAGHLIIGLLSIVRIINIFGIFSSLILQSILLILEFGVAVIQGFVFRILLLLYALEYY